MYFLNTFEILETLRTMVFQLRIEINILIREDFLLNQLLIMMIDHYLTREEMRRVDQEYAIGIAIIVILV